MCWLGGRALPLAKWESWEHVWHHCGRCTSGYLPWKLCFACPEELLSCQWGAVFGTLSPETLQWGWGLVNSAVFQRVRHCSIEGAVSSLIKFYFLISFWGHTYRHILIMPILKQCNLNLLFSFSAFLYCSSGALLCYLFQKVTGFPRINQATQSSCLQNDRSVTQYSEKWSK